MARCFGQPASDAGARTLNPYSYGFPVEIDIDASGVATPTEHYAMGRMALELELAYVMPDNKTVYMTDSRDWRRAPTPHRRGRPVGARAFRRSAGNLISDAGLTSTATRTATTAAAFTAA